MSHFHTKHSFNADSTIWYSNITTKKFDNIWEIEKKNWKDDSYTFQIKEQFCKSFWIACYPIGLLKYISNPWQQHHNHIVCLSLAFSFKSMNNTCWTTAHKHNFFIFKTRFLWVWQANFYNKKMEVGITLLFFNKEEVYIDFLNQFPQAYNPFHLKL